MVVFARLTCKDIALKRRDLPQAPSRRQAMCGGTSSRPHRSISHISRWGGPERGGSHGSHLSYRSMGQFDCGLCAQASRRRRCLTGGRADAYHAKQWRATRDNPAPRHNVPRAGAQTRKPIAWRLRAAALRARLTRGYAQGAPWSCKGSPPPPTEARFSDSRVCGVDLCREGGRWLAGMSMNAARHSGAGDAGSWCTRTGCGINAHAGAREWVYGAWWCME